MWLESKNEEWQAWRHRHLGASEIGAVLGVSEFMSAYDLWRVKTGRKEGFKGNFATERGQALEGKIIEKVEERTDLSFAQQQCYEHKEHPFLSATLDGIDHDKGVVLEVKALGAKKWEMVKSGMIPLMYAFQVQQQMMCSGAKKALFAAVSIDDEDCSDVKIIEVEPNEASIQAIIREGTAFWDKVTRNAWSDDEVAEAELVAYLEEIERTKSQIAELEQKVDSLRDKVRAQIDENGKETVGWIVRYVERKGAIDYKNVAELNGVDLEPYRKPPIKVLDIRRKN